MCVTICGSRPAWGAALRVSDMTPATHRMKNLVLPAALVGSLLSTGCPRDRADDSLTRAEAVQALDEATLESQGQVLAGDNIEFFTNFTLGAAVQSAAREVQSFVLSQLPCASASLADHTVTVVYGAGSGSCTYHGHPITGTSEITIEKTDASDVVVYHKWTALSNGLVQVDGTATVTWSSSNLSRRVQHDITIERLRDSKLVNTTGDRTQIPLDGDLSVGLQVDGTRSWYSGTETWDLAINAVQVRWVDPIPEAGQYVLTTPKGKTITLSFSRKDIDTITVVLAAKGASFPFDVTSTGSASAAQ
jgi:hypothetical protein